MTSPSCILITSLVLIATSLPAAAQTIDSNDIKRNAVRSNHVKKNSVESADIASGAVKSSDIRDGDVTTADLADGAVSGSTLADDAVTTSKIVDGAVTRSKLADGAVSEMQLDGGIGALFAFGPELGAAGDHGELALNDASGVTALVLEGDSANVTNRFSASADEGNGLVKAWARINADGTIHSCWNCSIDVSQTRKLSPGNYEANFTPLATDIRPRPRMLSLDTHTDGALAVMSGVSDRSGDTSSIFVKIRNTSNAAVDAGFTVFVF